MRRDVFEQALVTQSVGSESRARVMSALDELGAGAWPVDEKALATRLGQALAAGRAVVAMEDLVLAALVLQGVEPAWRLFEQRCRPAVRSALSRVQGVSSPADEEQALFVSFADPAASPLASYAGDGPLVGWLVVVATRRAWRAARASARESPPEDDALLERVADGQRDPAIEVFKATNAESFRASIKTAFARLAPRERNLLRLHHLEGVQTGELARLHGVHRATVVRWLADARQSFVANFRDEFGARLGVPRLEIDSLARVFQSGLDVSLPMESVDLAGPDEP